MAQNVVDFSDNPTGAELMDDYLAKDQQNVLTSNSGIQRPSYAVAGTKWLDTSVTPWLWKMYDGTSDIMLGTVNPSTHLFTPAGVVPSQDGQSGKFLQTNGSNTVWSDAVDYTNISNCLTEVPQISWRMSGNNVVFAAGTKAYKPDGTVITFASEKMADFSGVLLSYPHYAYADDAGNVYTAQKATSSTSQPSSPDVDDIWFDTANNVIKRYDGEAWSGSYSFPLIYMNGLFVTSTSVIAFGGSGFIGNTIFVLPGVKGLVPNGRKADGRLNNTAFTVTTPLTHQLEDNNEYVILLNGSSLSTASYSGNSYYDNESSTNSGVAAGYVEAGICSNMTNVVKNFSLKSVFCALDYAEFQQKIDELQEAIVARLPAGFVAAWPAYEAPSGWLVCDGSAISRATYDDLFAAIGTTFGKGDGSTTFELPDFRGDFLRGSLENTTPAIGTRQAEGLPNISGYISYLLMGEDGQKSDGALSATLQVGNRLTNAGTGSAWKQLNFSAKNSNAIYGANSHVTPVNNCIQWIIKY